MKNWQKTLIVIFGLFIVIPVFAAPVSNVLRNILPETTNTYDIGTTTNRYFHIYNGYSTSTAADVIDRLFVGNTSTSTISGNMGSTTLNSALQVASTTATSTFAYGIQLSGGCFQTALGTCLTSGGITSLNGLTGATQTFTNDTNVTMVSGGTAHVITWSGTLADSRVADDITLTNITQVTNRAFSNITGGTAGSLIFSNGTNLAQDNANLFWDDSANRLGLATTTPGSILSIQGAANFGNNAISTIYGTTTTEKLIATSTLIIPSGANLIASTTGAISIDTTVGQLMIATSTDSGIAVIRTAPIRLFSFRAASTTTLLGNNTMGFPPEVDPYRVEFIQCYVYGGTSMVINLTHPQGNNDTNTVTCTTTSTSTKLSIGTNNTWSAGQGMAMEPGTQTGTISELYVSIFGSWLRQ